MKSSSPQNPGAEAISLNRIFRPIFAFLASLQLAVGTLVTLMIVLAAGTIIESRYGADAARILIYGTPWFGMVLIVLAVNLACSAASRMPWKKKHIGFVLTHLGIIIILGGSMLTQQFAVDGQMALEEGSSGKWVMLKRPVLFVYSQALQDVRTVVLPERALRWKGHQVIADLKNKDQAARIAVTQFYPKARSEAKWKKSENGSGPAALKVTLKNAFVNVTQWLADTPDSREAAMGPAVLKIAGGFSADAAAEKTGAHLEIRRGEENYSVPLSGTTNLPYEKEPAPGLKVKVLELYEYAFVDNNVLKEGLADEHAANPAAVLEVTADGKTEKHTVFAQFPDFPTVHGAKSELGITVAYHGTEEHKPANELRFVPREDGLWYEITGAETKKGKVTPGQETATGWMDLKFTVEEWLPQAFSELEITPLADDDKSENAASAMELEVLSGNETRHFWLSEGAQKSVGFQNGLFEFVYGKQQLGLGFEVQLKDFRVKHDPGTEKAASFESDVVLKDFTHGVTMNKTISMNQPLVYKGYRFYQASYSAAPGGPEVSVFVVGADPGVPVKYAGALIMVGGILLMFYTRAYSLRNERGLQ